MAGEVNLSSKDYSWNNNDQVIIKNAGLINALIEDSEKAITGLSTIVSPISLDKITVDEYGTVIVTDAAFRRKVESLLPGGPSGRDTNIGACGKINYKSCPSTVEIG